MSQFIFRLLFCTAVTWSIYRAFDYFSPDTAHLGLVVCAPMWGFMFSRYLIEIFPAIARAAHRSAHLPWQGVYYAFDGRQIRFLLVDEVVWVVASDIKTVLDPLPDTRELRLLGESYSCIPHQKIDGFTESGLLKILSSRTSHRRATHDMIRFKHWLEHEAFPNVKRLPSSSVV